MAEPTIPQPSPLIKIRQFKKSFQDILKLDPPLAELEGGPPLTADVDMDMDAVIITTHYIGEPLPQAEPQRKRKGKRDTNEKVPDILEDEVILFACFFHGQKVTQVSIELSAGIRRSRLSKAN